MKQVKFLLFIGLLFISFNLHAQLEVGVANTPFGYGNLLNQKLKSIENHKIKNLGLFSVQLYYGLNENLSIETGLDYTLFEVNSQFKSKEEKTDSIKSNIAIIEIPIGLRYFIDDYFSVSGGALLGFDTNATSMVKSQSGVGVFLSAGAQYPFKNGISIFANPFLKLHSALPFGEWKNHQRIFDAGVKLGLSYKFN